MSIRVLTADDQPLMRTALRISLENEPDFEVVGEAADGRQAVDMVARLEPDVVVMDIRMPVMDGIAATKRIKSNGRGGKTKVLAITTFDLDDYVVEALRAGASGFLLKDATPEELCHAIRVIAAGNALLAPAVTRRLLDRYADRLPSIGPHESDLLARLTPREVEVLGLVAKGLSNTQIGYALHLAESSVKTHVGHLLAKLGKADRVQLVVFAYESGLIRPGSI
ncbi:MAG: response regulator [Geodermatophilaceae bacterium]